ncbi:MAG: ribosome silencing factor [Chloroflexi bacterium]|nr:ribosome silencing factor [Chloroflexota bacterium]MCI0648502.1 ribosome silencing factor [Chloroflexota bacterium]MCI0728518.1 ribosome silencing factor [Chloroflexota bacterium]
MELAHLLVDTVLDKKGGDIILLDIRDKALFTDFFLICTGESGRQLQALADGIAEDAKKKATTLPWGVEGDAEGGWILMDYGDVIVHLFSPDKRTFYNLEELWGDAHVVLRMQ